MNYRKNSNTRRTKTVTPTYPRIFFDVYTNAGELLLANRKVSLGRYKNEPVIFDLSIGAKIPTFNRIVKDIRDKGFTKRFVATTFGRVYYFKWQRV